MIFDWVIRAVKLNRGDEATQADKGMYLRTLFIWSSRTVNLIYERNWISCFLDNPGSLTPVVLLMNRSVQILKDGLQPVVTCLAYLSDSLSTAASALCPRLILYLGIIVLPTDLSASRML